MAVCKATIHAERSVVWCCTSGMIGNDFIPIVASFVTGHDWRPYMDIRGIPYSDLANAQVAYLIAKGRVNKTTIADFPFPVLDYRGRSKYNVLPTAK